MTWIVSSRRHGARRRGLLLALALVVLLLLGGMVAPAAFADDADEAGAFKAAADNHDMGVMDSDAETCATSIEAYAGMGLEAADITWCLWAYEYRDEGHDIMSDITYAKVDPSKIDSFKQALEHSLDGRGAVRTRAGWEVSTGSDDGSGSSEHLKLYYFNDSAIFFGNAWTPGYGDRYRAIAKESGFDVDAPESVSSSDASSDASGSSDSSASSGSPTSSAQDTVLSLAAVIGIAIAAVVLLVVAIVIVTVRRRRASAMGPWQARPQYPNQQYPNQPYPNQQYPNQPYQQPGGGAWPGAWGNGQYPPQAQTFGQTAPYAPQGTTRDAGGRRNTGNPPSGWNGKA